ncbi:hypothetical protein LCGC14_0567850 [marine sediment metagenome]|uniref:Uncharacterized protein n=1 Tax=marine sediment metagenome TaxID=412755 RepID=A0A0F9RJZ2_9ZZZZ
MANDKPPKPPKATKEIDLLLLRIPEEDEASLRVELDDLEAFVQARMDADKKWDLTTLQLVSFHTAGGGRWYLLASMTLDK